MSERIAQGNATKFERNARIRYKIIATLMADNGQTLGTDEFRCY